MRNEFLQLKIPLPIALVGLGISGEATRQLLISIGVDPHQILTFDQKGPADFQDPQDLLSKGKPQSLCVSPGVPLGQKWIQDALNSGLRLTSEMEISFAFLTTEKVIALTGSVGKSTTTSILGAGAAQTDPDVFVGGNLGTPLAQYSRELVEGRRNRAQYVILELSSYQLENFKNLKSHVSILTSLNPNHLERYNSLEDYYLTKLNLFRHTTEVGVLNRNGGDIVQYIEKAHSTHPGLQWILTNRESHEFRRRLKGKPRLVGSHNLDNLAVSFAVAEYFGWPEECFEAMISFPGLPHRLENCGEHQGILFLNDSKATAIESVLQAFQSVRKEFPDRHICLLLGGKDKNLPWNDIRVLKNDSNFNCYFFGEVGGKAQIGSNLPGPVFSRLGDCLKALESQVKEKDIVLLSPGGTSLDEFKNFEDRGQFFKNWILSKFQNS